MSSLRVGVISSGVGKSPSHIPYSFIFDEAVGFANHGLRVHIIRPIREPPSQSCGLVYHGKPNLQPLGFVPFLVRSLNCIPPHGFAIFPGSLLSLFEYAYAIANLAQAGNLDLLHAHFAYPEGFAGFIARARTKIPLVLTLHGYDILTQPSVGYGARLDIRLDKIIRRVIANSDAILTASSATYKEALRAGAREDKTHLIYNGVDIDRFNPTINGGPIREKLGLDDKFILLTVRSHRRKYGIEYVLKAMKRICEATDTVHLILGGTGPLKEYHENLAKHLGIAESVTFTGSIPAAELPAYNAACDVVIVPSLQEAFGLVVTEGMAAAKPVIGSAVGGIPDQVVDGRNGFLVPPGCPDEIQEKVLSLVADPSLCKRMGKTGRRIAESKFDIRNRIERIIKVYEGVVQ